MNSNEKGGINITVGKFIGACVGSIIAALIVGFTWGGWVTGSSAHAMAQTSAKEAVAERLAQICVTQFRQTAGAQAALDELKKAASYNRLNTVIDKPWVIMPGEKTADHEVASSCVDALLALKSV